MSIQHAIVHWLEKERYELTSRLHLRSDKLPVTERLERLLDGIRGVYRTKTGKGYGRFEDDPYHPFSKALRAYLEELVDFKDFSVQAMRHYRSMIESQGFATGGYVLFVEYLDDARRFMMMVALNDTKAIAFNREAMDFQETSRLDLDQLHQVGRVDLGAWLDGNSLRYLSFVKGRAGGEIAKYFQRFMGCDEYTGAAEQTRLLLDVVKQYGEEIGLDAEQARDLRTKAYWYCDERRKKKVPVELEGLARHLDEENPERFMVIADRMELGNSFDVDPRKLKDFKFVKYAKDGLSLTFDRGLLGNEVELRGRDLVVKNIPDALITEIKMG